MFGMKLQTVSAYYLAILLVGLVFFPTAAGAGEMDEQDMRQPFISDELSKIQRRVVSFWNVGGRRGDPGTYSPPGYMGRHENWAEFIEEKIEPEYEWGCRRWLVHNPFGRLWGEHMIFDQFLMASEHGFEKLTRDFESAWKAFMEERPDVEITF